MKKVITEIQFTELNNLRISQTGFLGLQLRKVVVPEKSIEKFKFSLALFNAEWKEEIHTKSPKYLEKIIEISPEHKIELEEGIGNLRDYDNDSFAIYDIYGDEFFNDFYHNTIVLPFKFIPELIDIICKRENSIKEFALWI